MRPFTASGDAAVPQNSLLVSIDCEKSLVHNCFPVASPGVENTSRPRVNSRITNHERCRVWSLGHVSRVLALLEHRPLVLLFPDDFAVGQVNRGDEALGISAAVDENAACAMTGEEWGALSNLDAPGTLPVSGLRRARFLRDNPSRPGPRH